MDRRIALLLQALVRGALLLALGCDTDAGSEVDAGAETGSDAGLGDPGFVGSCLYTNTFSEASECREYRGAGWDTARAEFDCSRVFFGMAGEYVADIPCGFADEVGRCVVGDLDGNGYAIVSRGGPSACGAAQAACETFAGGTFERDASCDSCATTGEVEGQPFIPPFTDCRAPLDGEPAGASDGQICTPTIISGSTEAGRRYADYADCDVVRTQRPYYAMAATVTEDPEDPRLDDSTYLAEVAWLREQAEASACTCCHTASETPAGASLWDTEAGPLWVDTISDEALAMLAGFTDSAAFGYLPAEENNGFDRSQTGLPTTDPERLVAFAEAELGRRGLSLEEARALSPFAPFFQELIDFEPAACEDGVGIDEEGGLRWIGGAARYVAVLRADATSPGVPPNWDLPEGVLWAISVPPDAPAMGCGMRYGELGDAVTQRVPESGAPPALTSGETYYLHVQRDVALPITRCLFVAP